MRHGWPSFISPTRNVIFPLQTKCHDRKRSRAFGFFQFIFYTRVMKKILIVISIVLVGGVIYWLGPQISKNLKPKRTALQKKGFDGKLYYDFTELDGGLVAKSGSYQVTNKEIENTAPMRSFRNKKRDILFVLAYKKYVADKESKPKNLSFSFKKISRAPSAILNQYGIPISGTTQVDFSAFEKSEGLFKVDGSLKDQESLDYDNFIWASFEAEIFRYKLSAIDKILKRKIIAGEAEKLKITTQQYKEKYIFSKLTQEISVTDIQSYMKKYNMDDTERNQKAAKNRLSEMRKRRGKDYILEKYIMELPVQIGLTEPDFELEAKNEWTPFIGDENSELKITLFSGTRRPANQELIKGLLPLLERYKEVRFNYRPFFLNSDSLQNITTQMHFCALMNQKEKFWDYFVATVGDFKTATESKLYEIADKKAMDTANLKKCFLKQQYKDVVTYHLDYAAYLGIQAGPVLYIGGEVLFGRIYLNDVEKIIQRKLLLPAAGIW